MCKSPENSPEKMINLRKSQYILQSRLSSICIHFSTISSPVFTPNSSISEQPEVYPNLTPIPKVDSNPESRTSNLSQESFASEIGKTVISNLQNPQFPSFSSHTDVINALLCLRHEPSSALKYFKWVENQPEFDGKIDCFCVLFHILGHFKDLRTVFNTWVSSCHCPDAAIVVDCLIDTSKRFGFDFNLRVFNFLLKGFVHAGRFEDAIVCFNGMVDNDIPLWVVFVNDLLNALVRKNMFGEVRELYDKIDSRGIVRDTRTVHVMMRAYLKEGKVDEAEKCFLKAREDGVDLGAGVYSCAVGVVCRKQNSNAACGLLREMKEKGWVPSKGTFNQAIMACVKNNNNMSEALGLVNEMISNGGRMNLVVATSLMKGYCVSGEVETALSLFSKIIEEGLSPNKVTFSVLMQGCCRKGDMKKAGELYEQMMEMGIEPDAYNVNSLIKGYLSAKMWEKAYDQFDKAVNSGIADVFSCNYMMSWLCRTGKVDEAQFLVWDKMVKNGITPNVVSYNYLILGYCKVGNVAMANSLYTEMVGKGFKPGAVTFTILMDGYFKKGEIEAAFNVFQEMASQGIVCTDHTYNTVICRLCNLGRTSEASKFMKDFIEFNSFTPSCMTYNFIINGFMKEGSLDPALSAYCEMKDRGISPDVVTYTTLIDGFCKSNNTDLALNVRKEMISSGIQMDVTAYSALIDGFCKRRDMECASRLFSELLENGLCPNIYIYNSMIRGYSNLSNMDKALCFHKKMIEQGVPCDLETYTTLIDGLLKEGKLMSASEFYAEMLAKGIEPDEVTCTTVIKGLCKKGQLENACDFLKEMDSKGLTPNSLIYNALIAAYFKEGNLLEAFRLHDEMLDKGLLPDKMTFDFLINGNFKTREDDVKLH